MKIALAAISLLLLPAAAHATDDDPICADRPGLSTPACTVPTGMVQVETGLADWSRDEDSGLTAEALTIGATAVKYGVSDRLHVEVDISPYNRASLSGGGMHASVSGFGDIGLAAKYRLTGEDSAVEIALFPFVTLPTAAHDIGDGQVEGGLIVPVGYAIPNSPLSLALSPELDVNADPDGSGHHLAMTQVVGLGASLGDRLSASVELAGSWDFLPHATLRQYVLGTSAALLASKDLQLDAGVNFGLNRAAADIELYSGFAVRF